MESLPKSLVTKANAQVLRYLDGKYAHSDLVEKFTYTAELLDDVTFYCPDIEDYRYVIAHTESVIFAFASGMRSIKFRLNREQSKRAAEQGGEVVGGLEGWMCFRIFNHEVDLLGWCMEAYTYAHQSVGEEVADGADA